MVASKHQPEAPQSMHTNPLQRHREARKSTTVADELCGQRLSTAPNFAEPRRWTGGSGASNAALLKTPELGLQ